MSSRHRLLIHTQKLHRKKKMMIIAIRLRTILHLLKTKHLWDQIQTQIKIHNTIHCKSQKPCQPEIFTRQTKNPSVKLQQQFSEVLSLENTEAENDGLRV